jgi:NAD+ diphosphatase
MGLHYTGAPVDRADAMRKDDRQIAELWHRETTLVVPLYRHGNFVHRESCTAIIKTRAELTGSGVSHEAGTLLGIRDGIGLFAVDCSSEHADQWLTIEPEGEFADLRTTGPLLPRDEAALLAYGKGILYWQQNNRFCARCGGTNQLRMAGHAMQCEQCEKQVFPRTDPAVIMLVERVTDSGERLCLLGRSPAWPEGVYSTLAGFVETGESLEEAVAREVFEEAGIVVSNARYLASQPWPFPQSIMLGFVATAESEQITIDENELAEARWFSDHEIASFGNWGDDSPGPKLPRPDSIARFLIDSWRMNTIDSP